MGRLAVSALTGVELGHVIPESEKFELRTYVKSEPDSTKLTHHSPLLSTNPSLGILTLGREVYTSYTA